MSFSERYGEEIHTIKKVIKRGLLILAIALLIGGLVKNVPAGHVGVSYNKLGGGINNKEFNHGKEGLWLGIPLFQTIKYIPTTDQSLSINSNERWAKDINGFPFGWESTIRYRIDPTQAAEIIKTKGLNYESMILPIFKSEAIEMFSNYHQENISLNQSFLTTNLKERIQTRLNEESGDLLKLGYITIIAVDLGNVLYSQDVETYLINKEKRKNEAEQQLHDIEASKLASEKVLLEMKTNQKRAEIETQTSVNAEKQKVDLAAYTLKKEAEAKAEAIRQIAMAYREVPPEYLIAKAYESIKPTDKIVIGFDSLTDSSKLITVSYKDLIDYLNQTKEAVNSRPSQVDNTYVIGGSG